MQPKQLANVLVKVLGLSLFIHGVIGFVSGLLQLSRLSQGMSLSGMLESIAYGVVTLAIGLYLIRRSRNITGWLFKGDNE